MLTELLDNKYKGLALVTFTVCPECRAEFQVDKILAGSWDAESQPKQEQEQDGGPPLCKGCMVAFEVLVGTAERTPGTLKAVNALLWTTRRTVQPCTGVGDVTLARLCRAGHAADHPNVAAKLFKYTA